MPTEAMQKAEALIKASKDFETGLQISRDWAQVTLVTLKKAQELMQLEVNESIPTEPIQKLQRAFQIVSLAFAQCQEECWEVLGLKDPKEVVEEAPVVEETPNV